MKRNNWIITRIILCLFALSSMVLNILYLSNIISENLPKIGFALVMLYNVYFIINDQKNHARTQVADKTNRAIELVMIVTLAAWVITYVMTIFR